MELYDIKEHWADEELEEGFFLHRAVRRLQHTARVVHQIAGTSSLLHLAPPHSVSRC